MAEEWNTEDMLGTYLFENTQLLENLQGIVLEQQDADCFDEDSINEIFRTMHTIKGSSAIMKFDGITHTAHKLEDIFFYLRESHPQNVPHMELITHVLDVADFISAELEKIQDGGEADADAAPLLAELEAFLAKIREEPQEAVRTAETKEAKTQTAETKTAPQESEKKEEPAAPHIYIPPKAEGSHFYILNIEYQPGIELANIHAFKLVHNLKGIAESLKYFPEDIITSEESADRILADGFQMFIQTCKSEQEIRGMISLGYDIKEVTISECTAAEFKEGLESFGVEVRGGKDTQGAGTAGTETKAHVPGDFVIKPQETKEHQLQTPLENTDEGYLGILAELIARLECLEKLVIQNPDLQVPGLRLDRFKKAACLMSAVSSDIRGTLVAMGADVPEEEEVLHLVKETLDYDTDAAPQADQGPEYKKQEEPAEELEAYEAEEENEEEELRNKYMTFLSGNECFGFKISYVTEVIIYQQITAMPECADYVKGIIHLRGKVVPVIDVRMRFGQAPLAYNEKTCIIVISYGEHMVGLMVEKIAEVVELPKDKLLSPPKVGWDGGAGSQFVYAVGKVHGEIKLLIDPRKLLPAHEMSSVLNREKDRKEGV